MSARSPIENALPDTHSIDGRIKVFIISYMSWIVNVQLFSLHEINFITIFIVLYSEGILEVMSMRLKTKQIGLIVTPNVYEEFKKVIFMKRVKMNTVFTEFINHISPLWTLDIWLSNSAHLTS